MREDTKLIEIWGKGKCGCYTYKFIIDLCRGYSGQHYNVIMLPT